MAIRTITLGLFVLLSASAALSGARHDAPALSLPPTQNEGWPLDRAHSRVTFTVTKWGFVGVEGRFKSFVGSLQYDAQRPEASRISWSVDVNSVDTGEPDRDHALQASEYFDAAHFPTLTFESRQARRIAAGELEISGPLTIRGVSKTVTFRAHDRGRHDVPDAGTFQIFDAAFTVDRYDYGVVGGSLLGPVISREVKIALIAAARR